MEILFIYLNSIYHIVKYCDFQGAQEYIDNLRKKFGAFIYAPLRTPLNPQKFEEHTNEMVGMASNKSTAPSQVSKTIDESSNMTADLEFSFLQADIGCNEDRILGSSDATKRPKRPNAQKTNGKNVQPVEKKRKSYDDNDSDDDVEILQRVIERSREKKQKQKAMHDEAIKAYERKITTIVNEHSLEIIDSEKDFNETIKSYQQKIMEKEQEKTDLERKIVDLEAKYKTQMEERKAYFCYECGEVSSSLVFCSKQCTENHIKSVINK